MTTATTTARATFTVGTVYTTRFATDSSHVLRFRVVKRTARFVTVENIATGEIARVGIKGDDPAREYALPMGTFSMAPVIVADRAA